MPTIKIFSFVYVIVVVIKIQIQNFLRVEDYFGVTWILLNYSKHIFLDGNKKPHMGVVEWSVYVLVSTFAMKILPGSDIFLQQFHPVTHKPEDIHIEIYLWHFLVGLAGVSEWY